MPGTTRIVPALLVLASLGAAPRSDVAPQSLTVYPAAIDLANARAEQRVGVMAEYADGSRRDLSRAAVYRFTTAKIAAVSKDGVVRPVADGTTPLVIEAGGKTARVPVKVKGIAADAPVSFSREVEPVLTRAGCNSGACHGAQHGKGGFRLSLFGFDPVFDHPQIVQSAEGRRLVLSEPERSILLQKPAGVMEHAGGERFKVGSRYYDILKRWIEDGVPGPSAREPEVKQIEVWPAARRMTPGEQQQVLVRATWSDGLVEDVTSIAQLDALNDSVAGVTADGLITAKGVGETHVMVRFAGQARVVQVTLAYGPPG